MNMEAEQAVLSTNWSRRSASTDAVLRHLEIRRDAETEQSLDHEE